MKKLLLFVSLCGVSVISNAMDHQQKIQSYLQTHEWTKMIGYMVDNHLSAQALIQLEPKVGLDLGYGDNRLLIKFIAYIDSKKTPQDKKEAAARIFKSLLIARKFDLKKTDGFEGDVGAKRFKFFEGFMDEWFIDVQGRQIIDLKKRVYTLQILMVVGVACLAAAGLYVWYMRAVDTQEDDEQEDLVSHEQPETVHLDVQNSVAV